MKGSPAVLGGPLTGKPTWFSTFLVPNRVGFFFAPAATRDSGNARGCTPCQGTKPMMAQQLAQGPKRCPGFEGYLRWDVVLSVRSKTSNREGASK